MNFDSIIEERATRATKGLHFALAKIFRKDTLTGELLPRAQHHLTEVANWSTAIQFFGMSRALPTETSTIALHIDTVPRKFRGARSDTAKINEVDLIAPGNHVLILGDPGSGKTTTIQRLVNSILFNKSDEDNLWEYPVVVRVRSLGNIDSIYPVLADALGITYKSTRSARRSDSTNRTSNSPGIASGFSLTIGGEPIEKVLPLLLDATSAIVLVDGLDEALPASREPFEASLNDLASRCLRTKIIASCRSGDFTRNFPGFEIVEICPLDVQQIFAISTRWLPNPRSFLEKVETSPFYDLAMRPLLLCQLIVLFQNTGYLPDRPAAVYQSMTRLLLEDWDRRRGVQRGSRYAGFMPDQKLEFLSALSYQLTYVIKSKRFTRDQLLKGYRAIYAQFNLPATEAVRVIEEIETHNGLLVESGQNFFEFSHLSLQEYLCAYYLVREPFSQHLASYFLEYPAPLAVATSLAADPGSWFANVVLFGLSLGKNAPQSLKAFLSRLRQEAPRFPESAGLGFAMLHLLFEADETMYKELMPMLHDENIIKSLARAYQWYDADYTYQDRNFIVLRKRPGRVPGLRVAAPAEGKLRRDRAGLIQGLISNVVQNA